MSKDDALAAADALLAKQVLYWAHAASRDHYIASEFEKTNDGQWQPDLVKTNTTGENARERVRSVERHAMACTDMALKLRRELLGERRTKKTNGGNGDADSGPAPLKMDAAARALLEKRKEKSDASQAKARATRAAKAAAAEVPPTAPLEETA